MPSCRYGAFSLSHVIMSVPSCFYVLNFRKILKGAQLDASTLAAQHDELERKRRLQERLRDGLPCPTTRDVSGIPALEGLLEGSINWRFLF